MKKQLLMIILLCFTSNLLIILPVFAARNVDWEYRRALSPAIQPAHPNTKYGKVVLPAEVLGRTREGLPDLRIIDDRNREVPFVLQSKMAVKPAEWQGELLNQGSVSKNIKTVIVDTGGRGLVHNRAELNLSGRDFIATTKVEGSDDKVNWLQLADGVVIDKPYRYTTLDYGRVTFRYLRLTFNIKEGDIGDIEAVKLFKTESESNLNTFSQEAFIINSQPKKSQDGTAAVWNYKSKFSLSAAAISFSPEKRDYFERKVEIKVSDDGKHWVSVAEGFIFRYPDGSQSLLVHVPDVKGLYWQVLLYHYDDKPLKIKQIVLHPPLEEVIFPRTDPDTDAYRHLFLVYGNGQVSWPQYDLSDILVHSSQIEAPYWTLGNAEKLSNALQQKQHKPWTENHPLLLNLAFIFMIGILASLLWKIWNTSRNT